jgi:hypothetical protein
VLKGAIHNWGDNEATQILRTVLAAMPDGSKSVLIERILPERIDCDDVRTRAKFIHVFIDPGGRERTEAEFRALLGNVGLRLDRTIITPSPLTPEEPTIEQHSTTSLAAASIAPICGSTKDPCTL